MLCKISVKNIDEETFGVKQTAFKFDKQFAFYKYPQSIS